MNRLLENIARGFASVGNLTPYKKEEPRKFLKQARKSSSKDPFKKDSDKIAGDFHRAVRLVVHVKE
jgi:hypothetical protein